MFIFTESNRGSATDFILPKVHDQACNTFFFTSIKEWNSLQEIAILFLCVKFFDVLMM